MATSMIKVRLIPTLLLMDGRLIKTREFNTYRDVGNPATVAKVYDAQLADELVFLDITATTDERRFLLETIRVVAEECFMPLTAGGGVRTTAHASELLRNGADKVAINTGAIENPSLIENLAEKFGRSTVLVSIDYKKNENGKNEVYTHRGKQATGLDPVEWAREAERRGAGEILLTSVERVGTVQDLVDGIVEGHASAVAAGSIFHFTDQSIFKAHSHMRQKGLSVRK
jgi:cyclase